MTKSLHRTYTPQECITFRKTNEAFGGLSNMASGYALKVNGVRILTSEALYQACRFPHMPEVQRSIIMQASPMTAKMKSKPYRDQSRADWDQVRVKIMRWCLRVKLAQHWDAFGELLLRTGDKPIVEDSRKDQFWGAVRNEQGLLEGRNALGRLLMELREELKGPNKVALRTVAPLDIPDFKLYGEPIGPVVVTPPQNSQVEGERRLKPLGTRRPDEPAKVYAQPAHKADLFSEPQANAEVNKTDKPSPLPPYPAYKSTAIPWLPQVPKHWGVQRIKTLVREMELRSKDGKEVLMSLSKSKGLIPQRDLGGKAPTAKTHVGYKICQPDQIVMNRMQAWNGLFGLAKQSGMVSPDYAVFKVLGEQQPYFLQQLFRSPLVVEQFANASKGIGTGFNRLYTDKFGAIAVPVAPPEEQHLIVRYLRALDAKVKRYIRTKRKLIAALQEQKQAIIQRAVTRGLDPGVKLKPSGVEWLGEVPEHWEELPLKRIARFENTGSWGQDTGEVEVPVATTAQIDRDGNFNVDAMPRRFFSSAEATRYTCTTGDILVVKSSGSMANVISGKCGIIRPGIAPFVFSNFLLRVRAVKTAIRAEYLFLLLRSHITRERIKRMVSGSTYPNLKVGEYTAAMFPLPGLDEQDAILERLMTEVGSIDKAESLVAKDIAAMQEYHTRLIADVVTGAVDVREVARKLPEEDQMIGRSEDQMEPTFAEASVDEEEERGPEE